MPTYTFRCRKCGGETQISHGFNEPHPTICRKEIRVPHSTPAGHITSVEVCGGELVRVFDRPSVVYRGSGFYHTDKGLDKTILEEKREAAEGDL